MSPIAVRTLRDEELPAAARLVAQAMRDDPIYKAVFGPDPRHRLGRLDRFFAALIPLMGPAPLSAWVDGQLAGVVGFFSPGWPALSAQLRIAYRMITPNIAELWRLWHAANASDKHAPRGRYCQLGPVAVDVARQRQGIGSRMLEAFCRLMNEQAEVAFLETDKQESVRFYQRFGFEVTASAEILGTQNWWMRREAQRGR